VSANPGYRIAEGLAFPLDKVPPKDNSWWAWLRASNEAVRARFFVLKCSPNGIPNP